MSLSNIVFLISKPGMSIENVIVKATDREDAKRRVTLILGGNADLYVITPLTKPGSRIVILFGD